MVKKAETLEYHQTLAPNELYAELLERLEGKPMENGKPYTKELILDIMVQHLIDDALHPHNDEPIVTFHYDNKKDREMGEVLAKELRKGGLSVGIKQTKIGKEKYPGE